jgi:hypothetical protein
MNEPDPNLPFEAELQRLKPAEPPAGFAARLAAAAAAGRALPQPEAQPGPAALATVWTRLLRRLVPTAGVAALGLGIVLWWLGRPEVDPPTRHATPALRADDVQIDREDIAAFDTVALMPGGEPVRFRCRKWTDRVTLRDSARGIVIEERTPRLEVVPVSFETY